MQQSYNPMSQTERADGVPMPGENPMDEMEYGDENTDDFEIDGAKLQMLLFSRIQELGPEEMMILDDIITPLSLPVLSKIFPELAILFEKAMEVKMGGAGQQGPGPMPQQPMGPMPMGQMEQALQMGPTTMGGASRGLVG